MNEEYALKEGDRVRFNIADGIMGFGTIRGVATTEMAVIGCLYIVELDDKFQLINSGYSCIVCPEVCIERSE